MIKDNSSPEDDLLNGNCCDSPKPIFTDGQWVCTNCGVISGRRFINEQRRMYTQKEKEQRQRTEPRWSEIGSRTQLGYKKDSRGKPINGHKKVMYSRLSRIQKSLVSSLERNFWEAHPKLRMIGSKLNVPQYIIDTAWKIYKESVKKDLIRGRSIEGFVAGSLYASIRIHEFPLLFDEIDNTSFKEPRSIHKAIALIVREVLPEMGLKYKPVGIPILITKFSNELSLSMEFQHKCQKLYRMVRENGMHTVGKDPKGVVAGIIYLVGLNMNGERMTQKKISETTMITEVTLRNRIREIEKFC